MLGRRASREPAAVRKEVFQMKKAETSRLRPVPAPAGRRALSLESPAHRSPARRGSLFRLARHRPTGPRHGKIRGTADQITLSRPVSPGPGR
ncbi:hypothetical protein GCM10009525_38180 [Streptosporangium amethystogenes subsp. fukuiense]